jgi:hypothetical protein
VKARKLLAVALVAVLALVVLVLLLRPLARKGDARSVRLAPAQTRDGRTVAFDPAQSAALFVGVRKFSDPAIAELRYTVNDAVDLAYVFAHEPSSPLVKPGRVVLALSGLPSKNVSKAHLNELIAEGAIVTEASQSDILTQIQKQAAAVGPEGIFIVSLATHGYNSDGVPYVLAASSTLQDPETALSTAKMFDVASRARRSVIFVDACRERVTTGRSARPRPLSAAPLIDNMSKSEGQVIFYAAAAGKYAFDNERERNGVFTWNVLQALRGSAKADQHGLITVAAVAESVQAGVRSWGKHHRPPLDTGIQVTKDGNTDVMPLAFCPPVPPVETRLASIETVEVSGSSFQVFDEYHKPLWGLTMNAPISHAEVTDLDEDDRNEVVVASGNAIVAFNAKGETLWERSVGHPVRKFVIGELRLFPKRNQIVAISGDGNTSLVSILRGTDGESVASYPYSGPLYDVVIAARTSRSKPKIIVAGIDRGLRSLLQVDGPLSSLLMLDGTHHNDDTVTIAKVWYGVVLPAAQTIERLAIVPHDRRPDRDISLSTTNGGSIFLNFEGHTLRTTAKAHFELVHSKDG